MTLARWVFRIAGIYGLIVTAPMFFIERRVSAAGPPIVHPDLYYGFAGVVLAWQFVFLLIASDPPRFRPLMPVAWVEKLAYAIPVPLLVAQRRVTPGLLPFAIIDGILFVLFVLAFFATPRAGGRP
ncbi:MAG: hypothetical protein ACM3JJ_03790 [Hyphomicrobiales bacterium]